MTSLLQTLFHDQCPNHRQIGKIDLEAEITVRHVAEMEFSYLVDSRCFDSFSVSEKVKPSRIHEVLPVSRKELPEHLPVVGVAPNLDVNIEFLRVHDELPR